MTEHVKMLWDMDEDYHRTSRSQLDEGQIEDFERLLSESLQDKILLEIITWKLYLGHLLQTLNNKR
ncbi:YolD-like family protein [Metabacillus idriensis]|uniref:YolD-like family protein n=1 Tax=Metabacillus idriensis TaxID=324768 RepID=UPI001CD75B97